MQKRYKFLFYCCFFIAFLFLIPSFSLAITLEVSYPPLSTGSNITANTTVPEYLKYVFDFGIFIGFFAVFLSLVYAGILYFLSPVVPSALEKAKDRISGAISGLLILVLLYLIITAINPALSIFKTTELQKLPPPPPAPPPPPGVFLYKTTDCSIQPSSPSDMTIFSSLFPNTSSIPDLAEIKLNKQLKSIKIINNPVENIYFLSFLYQNPKFRGECLMINYDIDCKKNIMPFASSVDIYKYSFTANGDITIYRNPSFNRRGGYFTVKSSDIQSAIQQGKYYLMDLNNTKFADASAKNKDNPDGCTVPEQERDCVKWSESDQPYKGKQYKAGECLEYQCPNLAGKNITSMQINGDYLVVLIYYNPSDPQFSNDAKKSGAWNYCQSFPSPDDINKEGPRQIKWEDIRNKSSITLPNWILIIPIEK